MIQYAMHQDRDHKRNDQGKQRNIITPGIQMDDLLDISSEIQNQQSKPDDPVTEQRIKIHTVRMCRLTAVIQFIKQLITLRPPAES